MLPENIPLITRLDNGLRVVSRRRPGAAVSYIGVLINAGSRDDNPNHEGLAHFVEHTIFKGTLNRKNWQITSRMESVGGELNAYTSKEETMLYTCSPAGYEERAVELLADLIENSNFPTDEIEREREVVIEEIYSYLDSPVDAVYDEFEENAYAGSGLAHNILGSPESVRLLTGKDCREFIDRLYTPANMVVYCSSPIDNDKFLKLIQKYFGRLHFPAPHKQIVTPPSIKPFDIIKKNGNHQANSIIGARTFGRQDPGRFALFLLNNYLGGPGMNSRLNRELREKRGYVYAVDSTVSLMSDTGLMMVYFGCEPSKLKKCKKIIFEEIDRLCQTKLTDTALEKIKRQYCGQLMVGSDHIESRTMALAKSLVYFDTIIDIPITRRFIMEVTAEQLMETARLLAPERCSSLTLA